ncbi:MAG: acyl-CoA carboxylase subunit beta [Actinomycetia bacterium]|nr:acyl-CoA carboxylase subunit beta [Actinomycetes bacterium]MCP3911505.1 acyl-CoA carboxylase subunit beta [Actinomycetes bacterium]MCP4084553.1 acyl-CoA carboxylase subunit beta [Actinomycetes bacterium]
MTILRSNLDTRSDTYLANRAAMEGHLAAIQDLVDQAIDGGGEKYRQRHHQRGRLLVHERIELLLDPDTPFLELSTLAATDTEFNVGAAVITGVGQISGTECMILANDPTVRGGSMNPLTVKKILRALRICHENRLPMVFLVESGGADLPHQLQLYLQAGEVFRDITALSSAGIPTISLVFGNSTAGGAYLPGTSDYVVMVDQQAKVFLGGTPLVKMATGEDADEQELGGADMHSHRSGVSDYFAVDEHDALRIGRRIVAGLTYPKLGPPPDRPAIPPRYDPDEILGIVSSDLKVPFPVREVLARVVDDSEFDEFKPGYGTNLVTGFAHLHGYSVGVLANDRGVLLNEDANKAAQFIQLANQVDTPLVFVQNVTGYMVGTEYEQKGMVKHGSHQINAVTNSTVPHLTVQMGGSYGAGNYGMAGRPYNPRFLFVWPGAKTAVMGAEQLAGTLSIVARQSAADRGLDFDEEADAARRQVIEDQINHEELATVMSGQLYDDGIIDPRDTRDVLGVALSATLTNQCRGQRGYGVFRM